MQVFHPRHLVPLNRPETVTGIKLACQRWGFFDDEKDGSPRNDGIVIVSHSNGSVGHGWILKDCPTIAKRSAFMDPIVFCLWEGAVCERFCYRSPRTVSSLTCRAQFNPPGTPELIRPLFFLLQAIKMLLYYFVASEIGIANTIQRVSTLASVAWAFCGDALTSKLPLRILSAL
jgi:hypothetical protein